MPADFEKKQIQIPWICLSSDPTLPLHLCNKTAYKCHDINEWIDIRHIHNKYKGKKTNLRTNRKKKGKNIRVYKTYEQLEYTEKQAYRVASVTSGLRSPTKIWKCPKSKWIVKVNLWWTRYMQD